eukprot:gb/GFBE01067190.1/.p1 GENE.gb/GFBE01067190.1/~~gb/GFBE01067190.1/.p1  ORF type:complete len:112 (+),score=26.57 gb/GFBE01067190.1/:1-336(+)
MMAWKLCYALCLAVTCLPLVQSYTEEEATKHLVGWSASCSYSSQAGCNDFQSKFIKAYKKDMLEDASSSLAWVKRKRNEPQVEKSKQIYQWIQSTLEEIVATIKAKGTADL